MKKISLVLLALMLSACNSGSSNDPTEPKEPNEEDIVTCYIDGNKEECDKTADVVDGESKFGEGTW